MISHVRRYAPVLLGTGLAPLVFLLTVVGGGSPLAGLGAAVAAAAAAAAFTIRHERMRRRLEASLAELHASRDELRASLGRLGDTLRSTHDMTSLLRVVLETARRSMKAKAGAVYLLANTRNELTVKCAHNLDKALAERRIRVGEGIAGRVAQTRAPVLKPSEGVPPVPSDSEPRADTMIAVPLESATQLIGVLALYGREVSEPFGSSDLETVLSLARQAAVGIENVLLHQEAQRLSITDGLTGVWNRRYLKMRLSQEVERSIRFRRPLSVVLLDVDHFKSVNDRYGHQRGDAVLVELAQRVVNAVRGQVDTLARLGGEEFVLVLPETPADGARIVCEKILTAVSSEPFGSEGEDPVGITVSIGCANFPHDGSTPQPLLRAADFAMYEAKARGRNCVVMAEELDAPPPAGSPDFDVVDDVPPVARPSDAP